MKKLLRFSDCFVLLAAIIGCLLRFWLRELHVPGVGAVSFSHPAWILLLLLSTATVVFLFLTTRQAGDRQDYPDNFPKSIPGAVTYLILAMMLGYSGITGLVAASDLLGQLTSLAAMLSAISLGVAGIERFSGNQPVFFVHMVPCIYFALRLFDIGREFGADPNLSGFLFTFLSSLTLIPAYYWLWSFDVGMGNRQRSLFWSLTAAFFCLLATFDVESGWMLYMVHAAVLLSNVCLLQPLYAEEENMAEEIPAETEEDEFTREMSDFAASTVEAFLAEEDAELAEEDFLVGGMPILEPMAAAEEAPMEEILAEEAVPAAAEAPIAEEPAVAEVAPVAEDVPVAAEVPAVEETPVSKPKSTFRKPSLETTVDPDLDLDAFLADLKLYLDNEQY